MEHDLIGADASRMSRHMGRATFSAGLVLLLSASPLLAEWDTSIVQQFCRQAGEAFSDVALDDHGSESGLISSSSHSAIALSCSFSATGPRCSLVDGFEIESGDAPMESVAEWSMPMPPGGSQMVLSGLLVLGSFQCVRSIRGLHLSSAPDWYHPGGPMQIGHHTVLDWEVGFAPVVLSISDEPTAYLPQLHHWLGRNFQAPRLMSFALPVLGPRAPPAC